MAIPVIGAGLAGATVAQRLAYFNYNVIVYDERSHVGGNVHTERGPSTGVMVHKYGPHIFHTDDVRIWDYARQFADMRPYVQRTKAISRGEVYSWPVNLHTINQFYGKSFTPSEAEAHLREAARWSSKEYDPASFAGAAVAGLGDELYHAFLSGYTSKQWGRKPSELPASVLKRLPVRFNYDDNAYEHKYQGIPFDGYTKMVENMLDHPRIKVRLREKYSRERDWRYSEAPITFYSGPLDEWFEYRFGPLAYRTLDLEHIVDLSTTDYQGCAVMNHCDLSTPYTRSTEHRHFTPWEKHHNGTVITREWPREWRDGDIRYYPIPLANEDGVLQKYQELAAHETGVAFIGRLGTYQYLDMDKTISASIQRVREVLRTGA